MKDADSSLHRVRQLRWQARATSTADAFALRTLLRDCSEAVQTAIEQACAAALREADHADTVWQVPRLVLRIQAADVAGLGTELPGRVALALRDALADAGIGALQPLAGPGAGQAAGLPFNRPSAPWPMGDSADPTPPMPALGRSPKAHAQAGLRHYLQHGALDWARAGQADDAVQPALRQAALDAVQAVLAGTLALDTLLPQPASAIKARLGALQRWLQLLPPAWRWRWIEASPPPAGLPAAVLGAWQQGLREATPPDIVPWMALWLAWGDLRAPATQRAPLTAAWQPWVAAQLAATSGALPAGAPWLQALVKALGSHQAPVPAAASAQPAPMPHRPQPGPMAAEDTNPATLAPLAGLVLLHPYLPRFLAGCGVLSPDGRAIPNAHGPRACALLHALAWGDGEAFEHQLPLVKLLLGLPPDVPFTTLLPRLSAGDLDEVAALLDAVRNHWAALSGTGIDGLRLSFLRRRGLLRRGDGAWQLHVQAESFDVLLDLLPWHIGLVKLPWMPQPLSVSWP